MAFTCGGLHPSTLGRLDQGGEVDKLIEALQRARGGASPPAFDGLRFTDCRNAGDVWALFRL